MSRPIGLEIDSAPPPSSLAPDDNYEDNHLQGEDESTRLSRARRSTARSPQHHHDAAAPTPLQRHPPRPPPTAASVVLRYFALSAVAVLLTIACPGRTVLWNSQQEDVTDKRAHPSSHASSTLPPPPDDEFNSYDELQWWVLTGILLSFVVTEILFVRVVRSNPGYVLIELMDELNRPSRDGAVHFDPENSSSASNSNDNELRSLLQGPAGQTCDEASGDATKAPSAAPTTFEPPSRQQTTPRLRQRRPYCDVCRLEPPLRAHHCKTCRKCVATFDHHCPLVGNCVGERNRAVFVAFLFAQAIGVVLCAEVILSSRIGLETLVFGPYRGSAAGARIHPNFQNLHGSNKDNRVLMMQAMQVLVTELYVVPIAVVAVVMAVSHAVMVACNVTTFEIAKSHRLEYLQQYDITDCPFSSGLAQNVLRVAQLGYQEPWVPYEWSLPPVNSDSSAGADCCNHIWRNNYWSCCKFVAERTPYFLLGDNERLEIGLSTTIDEVHW
jgi:DHHC palmitoyltransferase